MLQKVKDSILRSLLSIVVISLSAYTARDQVKSFSPDNEVFIGEFVGFIEFTGLPNVITRAKAFQKMWENDSFTDIQKTHINRLCNNMRIKQLPVEPYFQLVIETVLNYKASGLGPEVLQQWRNISKNL